jgi:hypothetical protein
VSATTGGVAETETEAEVAHEEAANTYSNRVPTAVAQPVPITLLLTSRISMTELETNSSPLAPSSNAAVIFCDPCRTALAS